MYQTACIQIVVPQQKWNNTYLETTYKLDEGKVSPTMDSKKNYVINNREELMKTNVIETGNVMQYGLTHPAVNRCTFLDFSKSISHRATNFANFLVKTL